MTQAADDGREPADPVPVGEMEELPGEDIEVRIGAMRMAEAMLFASAIPLSEEDLAERLPGGVNVPEILADLARHYAPRGVNLVRLAGLWMFRTAEDLGFLLQQEAVEQKRLSRAALETLAIIAYHQPVTRAEIEEIRGVSASKGTVDVLLEAGWIRMRGRRRSPGRPVTYGTTDAFLVHFGLDRINDLPGLDELRGAGLLDGNVPAGFRIPMPSADDSLLPDEDPLDAPDLLDWAPHEDEGG
jgi:segregation and condensation protein B